MLSYIENGDITLIASTTENPFFYVYNAILSRSSVFEFKVLKSDDIVPVIFRAVSIVNGEENINISLSEETAQKIARAAAGDVRRALNMLELCIMLTKSSGDDVISEETAEQILSGNSVRYDREGDEHYDIVSAYQKSLRGSDANAALYYLARLLAAGDLPSACRRLMVCACEDVGLAYPQIIPIVKSAVDIANSVGMPEARIPLADAVILVANCPKSNSGVVAIDSALNDIQSGNVGSVPRQLQNKHYDGEEAMEKYRAAGEKPYFVPMGGSNELGTMGYYECAQELDKQVQEMGLENARIIVTTGSLGTYMGLFMGLKECESKLKLTGICISPSSDPVPAKRALGYFKRCKEYFDLEWDAAEEDFDMINRYHYGAYNNAVADVRESVYDMGRKEGIILDACYTGKTFNAIRLMAKNGEIKPGENIIFIHTGGVPGIWGNIHRIPFEEELKGGVTVIK